MEIIAEETVNLDTLPEDVAARIREAADTLGQPSIKGDDRKDVNIYTHLKRGPKKWAVYQECRGVKLPGSEGSYKPDACPWLPVRMYSIAGENYGGASSNSSSGTSAASKACASRSWKAARYPPK